MATRSPVWQAGGSLCMVFTVWGSPAVLIQSAKLSTIPVFRLCSVAKVPVHGQKIFLYAVESAITA
jgi:hypothetical protein